MSTCTRKTIVTNIVGNAKNYFIDKEYKSIFIPANKFGGRAVAYKIAESLVNKAHKIFDNKVFGNSTSLNTNFKEGVGVNITPSKKLIDVYETNAKKTVSNNDGGLAQQMEEERLLGIDEFGDSRPLYQLPQGRELEEYVASEKTIRDLAARMSDRIGIFVEFESDRTKQYRGKLENNTAVVNLAYATLDTVPHEVLSHPIIRALKLKSEKTIESEIDKMIEMGIIKKEC